MNKMTAPIFKHLFFSKTQFIISKTLTTTLIPSGIILKLPIISCPKQRNQLLHISSVDTKKNDGIQTENDFENDDSNLDNDEYKELKQYAYRGLDQGHRVFVVQPKIRWGPKINWLTKPEFQLAEAVTLIDTLNNWEVGGKCIIPVRFPERKMLFSSGQLINLKHLISEDKFAITAIFLGLNMLTGLQQLALEAEFGIPVYDRYTIVLQIFADHARTHEAKLQVALAEIPFLKSRLDVLKESKGHYNESGKQQHRGTNISGETYMETRKRLLADRETKLRKYLNKLQSRRSLLRQNRRKKDIPTVAVVGYTNAGKTSLIKCLTDDVKLQPKNQLFATLDVTAHSGKLPSYQKAIFMDTVGFISDIPTALIGSFAATLEDVVLADLIIHIRDVSHPDTISQKKTVLNTLKELNLPQTLLDTILEVGNKVDLMETLPNESDCHYISSTTGYGIANLMQEIEESLMKNTGLIVQTVRIPMGGEESRWLYKNATVTYAEADPENANYMLAEIVFTPTSFSIFKHHYKNLIVVDI